MLAGQHPFLRDPYSLPDYAAPARQNRRRGDRQHEHDRECRPGENRRSQLVDEGLCAHHRIGAGLGDVLAGFEGHPVVAGAVRAGPSRAEHQHRGVGCTSPISVATSRSGCRCRALLHHHDLEVDAARLGIGDDLLQAGDIGGRRGNTVLAIRACTLAMHWSSGVDGSSPTLLQTSTGMKLGTGGNVTISDGTAGADRGGSTRRRGQDWSPGGTRRADPLFAGQPYC